MRISKTLYRLLVVILSLTLIISGTFVARYYLGSAQQKEEYDELAGLVEQVRSETQPQATLPQQSENTPASTDPTEPAEPVMLAEYAAVWEKNPDTVGWITIEGTPVNYPVMQTPDRTDYYLTRNFNKQESAQGCIYVRESCDVFAPSDNVTIYGHHMKDGSMFGSLKKFQKKSFWEEHHSIRFDTLYERHSYTVFAVFATTASVGKGFSYHTFEYAEDAADFDDFIASCKALSFYDTGITPSAFPPANIPIRTGGWWSWPSVTRRHLQIQNSGWLNSPLTDIPILRKMFVRGDPI